MRASTTKRKWTGHDTGSLMQNQNAGNRQLLPVSLVRSCDDDSKVLDNLTIKVRLSDNLIVIGWLQHYDLNYDLAVINIERLHGFCAPIISAGFQVHESNSKIVALGRCFNSGVLTISRVLEIGEPSSELCEAEICELSNELYEHMHSTYEVDKVWVGGPIVGFNGRLFGINCYCGGRAFLSRSRIVEFLENSGILSLGAIKLEKDISFSPKADVVSVGCRFQCYKLMATKGVLVDNHAILIAKNLGLPLAISPRHKTDVSFKKGDPYSLTAFRSLLIAKAIKAASENTPGSQAHHGGLAQAAGHGAPKPPLPPADDGDADNLCPPQPSPTPQRRCRPSILTASAEVAVRGGITRAQGKWREAGRCRWPRPASAAAAAAGRREEELSSRAQGRGRNRPSKTGGFV
ncbi:hypothetical protein PR202_gb02599 [Eleusine coracana subsp. coracana]|uniref:Uncharacterized protein n=1 Tax=Eleusine coracana subsp. coracana TaxID=191504 RepID=A0AAV5DYQ4_ELECO|nr:hypothetical protein PR202_gb02599 [Eleusine coracana subsp. coracana]